MNRYQIKCGWRVERLGTYELAIALARKWTELYNATVTLSDTKRIFKSTIIQKEQ